MLPVVLLTFARFKGMSRNVDFGVFVKVSRGYVKSQKPHFFVQRLFFFSIIQRANLFHADQKQYPTASNLQEFLFSEAPWQHPSLGQYSNHPSSF